MTSGAEAWLVDERWFKAYPLDDNTTIGRSGACSIILRDPSVSRVHARVRRSEGVYVLHPEGGTGTKLNGRSVETDTVLEETDIIEIASTSLRFTRHAPTGEMFVVSRDYPTTLDRSEPPTRDTLHALHPITLVSRTSKFWRAVIGLVLLVLFLLFVLASF
jgi:hypothetical protein